MAKDSSYAFGPGRGGRDSPGGAKARSPLPSTHDYRGPITDRFPSGKVTHAVHSPKGERASDYPQEPVNPLAADQAVRIVGGKKELNHGSIAHGGPNYDQVGASAAGAIPKGGEGAGK